MSPDETHSVKGQDHLHAALKWLKKATALLPDEPVFWFNKAWVEDELQQYRSAVESLKKAIEISPDMESAHYNMACAFSKMSAIESQKAHRWTVRAITSLERIPKGSNLWSFVERDGDLQPLFTSDISNRLRNLIEERKPWPS